MTPQVDPSRRLGCCGRGIQDIKEHPWFGGLDWALVLQKMYRPPVLPAMASPDDASNFDDYSSMAPMRHPFALTREQQAQFACF